MVRFVGWLEGRSAPQVSHPAPQERAEKVRQYLADLEEHDDDLTDRQHEFVRESRERFARYGAKTLFSDKQFGWLKGLWEGHCDGESEEEVEF